MSTRAFHLSETIPVLETERLKLRGHRLDDFVHCAAMWADSEVTRYIGGKPFTEEESWTKFLRYAGHWTLLGFGYWVAEEKTTGTPCRRDWFRRLQARRGAVAEGYTGDRLGPRFASARQGLCHRSRTCSRCLGRCAFPVAAHRLHYRPRECCLYSRRSEVRISGIRDRIV